MKNFVDVKWLEKNIENVILIDVRFDLHNKEYGKESYEKGHIEGAYFLDLDKDLAGEKMVHGGARPLPKIENFVKKIESFGITEKSLIILYDDNMVTAARGFWMLKYLGHKDVRILDGGYSQWIKNKGATTTKYPKLVDSTNSKKIENYKYDIQSEIYVDIKDVGVILGDEREILVECRSFDRYLGKEEPFYHKAGHIPKSICIDSKSLLKNGKLRKKDELLEIFKGLEKFKSVIFSCGSGVNASLDYAVYDEFYSNGKVYIGGYSDWISYDDNPVETIDESYLWKQINL